MKIFRKAGNKLNYKLAAGIFVGLLLLATISPGLVTELTPTIQSTNVSTSAYTNSYEYTVYPTQTETEYARYEPITVCDYSFAKKSSANGSQSSLRNYENRNGSPQISGPVPILPNFPHKDINSAYLLIDIPPPSSHIRL
jgi:hypothetical protein